MSEKKPGQPRAYRERAVQPSARRENAVQPSARREQEVSDAVLIAVMREYDAFFWCEAGRLAVQRCYGEPLPAELRNFCRRWKNRLMLIADRCS